MPAARHPETTPRNQLLCCVCSVALLTAGRCVQKAKPWQQLELQAKPKAPDRYSPPIWTSRPTLEHWRLAPKAQKLAVPRAASHKLREHPKTCGTSSRFVVLRKFDDPQLDSPSKCCLSVPVDVVSCWLNLDMRVRRDLQDIKPWTFLCAPPIVIEVCRSLRSTAFAQSHSYAAFVLGCQGGTFLIKACLFGTTGGFAWVSTTHEYAVKSELRGHRSWDALEA
jgi:hypothetical protein